MQFLQIVDEIDDSGKVKSKTSKRYQYGRKTRTFEVLFLGSMSADNVWDATASKSADRPVLLMYAGTESTVKYFTANATSGRKLNLINKEHSYDSVQGSFEFLKSENDKTIFQTVKGIAVEIPSDKDNKIVRTEEMVICTIYKPSVFMTDVSGMEEMNQKFVSLAPRWWIQQQRERLASQTMLVQELMWYIKASKFEELYNLTMEQLLDLMPIASYFYSYLENRIESPVPNGLGFQLQLFLSALKTGVAKIPYYFPYDRKLFNFARTTGHDSGYATKGIETWFEVPIIMDANEVQVQELIDNECIGHTRIVENLLNMYPELQAKKEKEQQDFIDNASIIAAKVYSKNFPELDMVDFYNGEIIKDVQEFARETNNAPLLRKSIISEAKEEVKSKARSRSKHRANEPKIIDLLPPPETDNEELKYIIPVEFQSLPVSIKTGIIKVAQNVGTVDIPTKDDFASNKMKQKSLFDLFDDEESDNSEVTYA